MGRSLVAQTVLLGRCPGDWSLGLFTLPALSSGTGCLLPGDREEEWLGRLGMVAKSPEPQPEHPFRGRRVLGAVVPLIQSSVWAR